MSTDNSTAWSDRGRAHEDEYFRRRDQELVESMFRRAEEEAAIQRLAAAVGVHDETTLRELQRLGYTADTAPLLYLVPPIEVAWADGLVSEAERNVVVAAARAFDVEPSSQADGQVREWLASPPAEAMCAETLRVLETVLGRRPPEERAATLQALRETCTRVAWASGGVFGIYAISKKEQRALDRIFDALDLSDVSSAHV
jgi:tellurite resistance protein